MKVAKILSLAVAMTLVVASSANAAGRVWFDAAPSPAFPGSSVLTLPGSPTSELQCDLTQGLRCEWIITVMYDNSDGGAFSWGLDVGTTAPEDEGKFSIKNISLDSTALTAGGTGVQGINQPGGLLVFGAGGGNTSATGAPAGLYRLMQFTLSKVKQPGELNTSFIYAGIQVPEFGGNDANGYEIVAIGPNAPVMGYNPSPFYWPGIALPGPVIVVRNVPEPATLGLIGLGTLVLLRRRK